MYKDAISKLSALDLVNSTDLDIRDCINMFGPVGIVEMTLHAGKNIIRARPNGILGNAIEPTFTEKSQLLFKPQKYNTTYQRASTPNQTMFYGVEYSDNDVEIGNTARLMATLEASSLMRNDWDGEEWISYGRFIVTKDIPLIAICYQKDFITRSKYNQELWEAFKNGLATQDAEMQEKSLAVTDYLANEFAKSVSSSDSHKQYMISAIYSEMTVNNGKAGIYYPSVKNKLFQDGLVFNVAIAPEIASSSLKLIAAGECTIYKKGPNSLVDNETVCSIDDDTVPFKVLPVDPKFRIGPDDARRRILEC